MTISCAHRVDSMTPYQRGSGFYDPPHLSVSPLVIINGRPLRLLGMYQFNLSLIWVIICDGLACQPSQLELLYLEGSTVFLSPPNANAWWAICITFRPSVRQLTKSPTTNKFISSKTIVVEHHALLEQEVLKESRRHTFQDWSCYIRSSAQGWTKKQIAHINIKLLHYMMACGLPVSEDEWGADICSHPRFIVPF